MAETPKTSQAPRKRAASASTASRTTPRPTARAKAAASEAKASARRNIRAANNEAKRDDSLAALKFRAKQLEAKRELRRARLAVWRGHLARLARGLMVTGPVAAPMAVAWTGQSGFAQRVLGWNFVGSLLYAAAYELTTVFCAWMRHEARAAGDTGVEFRLATWIAAAGSATQQYWHYSTNWQATPRAVTYASMTIIGLVVWELYERLDSRKSGRAAGRRSQVRPKFGLARWVRFPRRTFRAWSATIMWDLPTIDLAWSVAAGPRPDQQPQTSPPVEPQVRQSDLVRPAGPVQVRVVRVDLPVHPAAVASPTPPQVPAGPAPKALAGPPPVAAAPAPTPVAAPTPAPQPRPAAEASDSGEFEPTAVEIQAINDLVSLGQAINRANVAKYLRVDLQTPTNTTRAGAVARWGRDNRGGLRAAG